MNRLIVAAVLSTVTFTVSAQVLRTENLRQIPGVTVASAVISPDGTFVIAATGDGLSKVNIADGTVTPVVKGPAYGAKITDDGRHVVFFRPVYKDKYRYVSLVSADIADGSESTLVAPTRHLNSGMSVAGSTVNAVADGKALTFDLDGSAPQTAPVASIDYGHLAVTVDGNTSAIDPFGRASYLWPSISPDGKRVVWRLSGYGTYTSAPDGSDIRLAGDYMMPVWAGNDVVIGVDERETTAQALWSSALVAVDINTGEAQRLTPADIIATGPSVSADGRRLSFNTTDGRLFILDIEREPADKN